MLMNCNKPIRKHKLFCFLTGNVNKKSHIYVTIRKKFQKKGSSATIFWIFSSFFRFVKRISCFLGLFLVLMSRRELSNCKPRSKDTHRFQRIFCWKTLSTNTVHENIQFSIRFKWYSSTRQQLTEMLFDVKMVIWYVVGLF